MAMYRREITDRIVDKAKSLGADLAGVAHVELLKQSPSHLISPKMESYSGVGSGEEPGGIPGEVAWPAGAKSAVVIAVEHHGEQPELDWWYGKKSPPGNRLLMRINKALAPWVAETFHMGAHKLPYHIEQGGIFLKDAAVLAGLGCIGKSNLLVTPEFGPRVRLRAILLDQKIAATGPTDFNPCDGCDEPCRQACPQGAFHDQVISPQEMNMTELPGRSGHYSRTICNIQMEQDIDAAIEGVDPQSGEMERIIKYCRRCELACPFG